MGRKFLMPSFLLCTAIFVAIISIGCATSVGNISGTGVQAAELNNPRAASSGSATIAITPNSPAETVRAFYKNLREKKFREAIFLTNLRPAIEGLTDTELRDFRVDLESIARGVPAELEINGEIVSGEKATVTAKIPDEDSEKLVQREIRLRRENGVWIILTVDEAAEQIIKKEGKNYFYALRIETHEDEARSMLERISKAQIAYAMQNGGAFAEIQKLVDEKLLPPDVKTSESTGYVYAVKMIDAGKRFAATASPAKYGKSGRLSFVFESDGHHIPKIVSKDNGGKPLGQ